MRLARLAGAHVALKSTASRKKKQAHLVEVISELNGTDIEIGVAYLCGEIRQPKLGVGYATLAATDVPAAKESTLSLAQVDQTLEQIALVSGKGSKAAKLSLLQSLLSLCTTEEQDYLRGLIVSELRQGALESLVVEGVAEAAGVPVERVRRAAMFSGSLRLVAEAALKCGPQGLAPFGIELFRPIQAMLAQPSAEGIEGASRIEGAFWEYKIDGARVQIHRQGDRVEVYSRKLNVVTTRVPELVEFALGLPCHEVVLDAEAVALRSDGSPEPFQVTMSRFSRQKETVDGPSELPLVVRVFDVLLLDGVEKVDEPLSSRRAELEKLLDPSALVISSRPKNMEEGQAFFEQALLDGHEGVMVKAADSLYQAGKRGGDWLKIKQVHTLDLVVTGAEWGSGRRKGKLSNLHLAARSKGPEEFVMLSKTFKGMTDAILEWQTKELLKLKTAQQGHIVYVRPELVVEVAFDGVLESSLYPAGLALRFARLRSYRLDKSPQQADTVEQVRQIFEQDRGRGRIYDEPAAGKGEQGP